MNQEVKADKGKWRLSIVPLQIVEDISEVREYGIEKYHDPDNWKKVEIERYSDALARHFFSFVKNPFSKDEESGIEHYKHMAANMSFICELMAEQNKGCVITECFYNQDTECKSVGNGHYDCPNIWID